MNFYEYWKYSKKERVDFLSSYREKKLLILPYWQADYSFDHKGIHLKNRAPIKDLMDWARQRDQLLKIFIPLDPCPLLPGGGLPHGEALYAQDLNKLPFALADENGELNHLLSAYEKKTPRYYYLWLEELKRLFEQNRIPIHWVFLKNHYPDKLSFRSYLDEGSQAFERAFSSYKKREGEGREKALDEENFRKMFSEFYLESAREIFSEDFFELKHLCYLKGGADNIFRQGTRPLDELGDISLDFCRTYTYGMIPHFFFASHMKKLREAWKFFQKISFSEIGLSKEKYMESASTSFRPLRLFKIWGDQEKSQLEESASELKLTTFFFNFFRWTYELVQEVDFSEENREEIIFCLKEEISEGELKKIARAFSKGHKIIFFQESLPRVLWDFWKRFISENAYFSEDVIYQGKISYFSNAQGGQVAILSRISLSRLGLNLAVELWEKLMEFFRVEAFKIHHSEGVNYFWETRDVRSHELSYKEVRRVLIHNTEGSIQRAHMRKNPQGTLIRVSERTQARISTDEENLWIEFAPYGVSILEFGMIES